MQNNFGHSSVSLLMLIMFLFPSSFFLCQAASFATDTKSSFSTSSSLISDLIPSEPIRIKLLAPTSVSKKHTRTRQNSRFLRNFPPVELLDLARKTAMMNNENEIEPMMNYNNPHHNPNHHYNNYNNHHHHHRNSIHYGGNSMSNFGNYHNPWPTKANRIDTENSPIFYIKLPPVPYVFMPGVGFVSPHPYSNAPSMPMDAGQGMMPPGFGSFIPSGQDSSLEQQNSQSSPFHSLPLKFLSNGRPHQIESPKRKRRPGIENKGAALISGGKYSFNGRPTAVFVVRSPVGSRLLEI